MKGKRVLLAYQEYNFVDDNGQQINGANGFIVSDKLQGENSAGYKLMKIRMSPEMISKVRGKEVPAVLDCTFEFGVDSQQRPTLNIVDFDYIKPFKFEVS